MLLGLLLAAAVPGAALAAPTMSEYNAGSGPLDAATGPDGNVWFAEYNANKIARVSPSGSVVGFSAGLSSNAGVAGITVGADGNIWFTETLANKIGRITPAGVITQFSTGISAGSAPRGITAGPDGNLWFTETAGNSIGRITPAGSVTQFSTGITASSSPWGITAGPDGNLWFTERNNQGGIGRITTGGVVTEFACSGLPSGITAGPDGNLWFAESANPGYVGRMTPSGTLVEFSTGLTHDGNPQDIAAGTDGNLYFTETKGSGALGRITPSGVIAEFTAGLSAAPYGIAGGGDGNMWFTENAGDAVGRLTVGPAVTTSSPLATNGTSATLAGLVTANAQATTYFFEWGPTPAYGTSTSVTSAGSGSTQQVVSAPISGLTVAGTYHYRIVATNASGTTIGQDVIFTAQTVPIVATGGPNPVGQASVTLNAMVDPNSLATSYHFEWGATTSYGSIVPSIDAVVGSDSTAHLVSQVILGLSPGTTYHVRVVATSSGGTTFGADRSFTTTLPPPVVTTGAASLVGQTDATLSASVDPNGSATTYHFDLGITTDYGSQSPSSDAAVGADYSAHLLTFALTGLDPGASYHYRVVGTSPAGVSYGADQIFTTQPTTAVAPPPPGIVAPPAPGPGPAAPPTLPPASRPLFGQSATIAEVSGNVLVRLRGSDAFIPLSSASTVPLGTTIDATAGTIRLTNVRDRGGKMQQGTFWGGSFTVEQAVRQHAATVLSLTPLDGCSTLARHTATTGTRARERHLWGRDDRGLYVTRGRSAVATVRGTIWLLRDTCAGTFVQVEKGSVAVRDLIHHRTVLVTAHHSYLARRR